MSQEPNVAIDVHLHLDEETVLVGKAFVTLRRGTVTTNFRYDPNYLRRGDAWEISPDLPIVAGSAVTNGLPGAMTDSAPDRWGRNLVKKRLQSQAHENGKKEPTVTEVDYLLGVSDLTRQGALRYTVDGSEFLAVDSAVPKLLELPRLLNAADIVSRDDVGKDDMPAIKALLDAGSGSLGGARPKASVRDGDHLLIAKFPHHNDQWDVMAWEMTALDLAEACGIQTPNRRLIDVTGKSVLLLERFDRDDSRRIPFISAMTLVQGRDGESRDYIEIAEALTDSGSNVKEDLVELWRRIAFSIAINNTDDHLRNHGFLRDRSGWRLSPVFDVNPSPNTAEARSTSINFESDADHTLAALFEASPIFGVTPDDASEIWDQVRTGVRDWKTVALANRVSDSDIRRFEAPFGMPRVA